MKVADLRTDVALNGKAKAPLSTARPAAIGRLSRARSMRNCSKVLSPWRMGRFIPLMKLKRNWQRNSESETGADLPRFFIKKTWPVSVLLYKPKDPAFLVLDAGGFPVAPRIQAQTSNNFRLTNKAIRALPQANRAHQKDHPVRDGLLKTLLNLSSGNRGAGDDGAGTCRCCCPRRPAACCNPHRCGSG